MAYRNRSARPHGSSLRKRRSIRPLVENLEIRLVLSQVPLAVPTNALAGASITSLVSSSDGLVSYPLANGGTALMLSSGDTGPLAVNGQNTSQPASARHPFAGDCQPHPRPRPGRLPLTIRRNTAGPDWPVRLHSRSRSSQRTEST